MMIPFLPSKLYDKLTLNITSSIKLSSKTVIPDFHNIDPTNTLFNRIVPPEMIPCYPKAYQTYIMLSRALVKAIPNPTNIYSEPFA